MQFLGCEGMFICRDIARRMSEVLAMKSVKGTVTVGFNLDGVSDVLPIQFKDGISDKPPPVLALWPSRATSCCIKAEQLSNL